MVEQLTLEQLQDLIGLVIFWLTLAFVVCAAAVRILSAFFED